MYSMHTVEPLNNGHVGTSNFVLYREVKCTSIIEKGPRHFVLYREVVLSLEGKMY